MRLIPFLFVAMLLVPTANADTIILFEDFEDATLTYSAPSDSLEQIADRDYYGRISTGFGSHLLTNVQGSMFYAAEDIDSAQTPIANGSPLDLNFSVNVFDFENLNFEIHVAEDDDLPSGDQDWDDTDHFLVSYQIDGGGFQNLFAVESAPGGTVNTAPREDTNFDGSGNGAEITSAFAQFSKSITGTGTTLDIRIRWLSNGVFAGDEDLAIDNVTIRGDFVGVPEPSTLFLLCGMAPIALLRRRQ